MTQALGDIDGFAPGSDAPFRSRLFSSAQQPKNVPAGEEKPPLELPLLPPLEPPLLPPLEPPDDPPLVVEGAASAPCPLAV